MNDKSYIFIDESGKPSERSKIFATKNTSPKVIRCNYPLKEVRTAHVSFSELLLKKYKGTIAQFYNNCPQSGRIGY